MKRFHHWPVVAALLLCLHPGAALGEAAPMPDPGRGYRRLHEGNSLTHPYQFFMPDLAHAAGWPEDEMVLFGAAGIPIDWAWYNRRGQFEEAMDELGRVDLLVVQPHGQMGLRPVHVEAFAAAQFYRRVLEKHPHAALLVYANWRRGAKHAQFDPQRWESEVRGAYADHFEPLVDILRAEFPDRPVYMIPAGQIFLRIHEIIEEEGNAAGFTSIGELFDKGGLSVHPNRKGFYAAALVHLSCYYGRSLVGNVPDNAQFMMAWYPRGEKEGSTDLTEEQSRLFQKLAWEVASTYPRTPISDVQTRRKEDPKPPTAPGHLATSRAGDKQVFLRWAESSDNHGVTFYSIYVNGELIGDTEDTSYWATGLTPGEANEVEVRAWDAAWNFSDAVAQVRTPAQEGIALLGWDLEGLENPDSLEPSVATDGVNARRASVSVAQGLTLVERPWADVMNIAGVEAKDLAGAIQADQYVTFTFAPEAGRRFALDSLSMVIKPAEGAHYALLSSATGFGPGDALAAFRLHSKRADIAFPLREVEALQDVAKPVEFRLYTWGSASRHAAFGLGFYGELEEGDPYEIHLKGKPLP